MAHLSKNNLTRFLSDILPRRPPSAFGQARVREREASRALSPGNFLCIHSILRHIYDAATTEQRVLL